MKTVALAALACMAASCTPRRENFDRATPGSLPEGWEGGVTVAGSPRWAVDADSSARAQRGGEAQRCRVGTIREQEARRLGAPYYPSGLTAVTGVRIPVGTPINQRLRGASLSVYQTLPNGGRACVSPPDDHRMLAANGRPHLRFDDVSVASWTDARPPKKKAWAFLYLRPGSGSRRRASTSAKAQEDEVVIDAALGRGSAEVPTKHREVFDRILRAVVVPRNPIIFQEGEELFSALHDPRATLFGDLGPVFANRQIIENSSTGALCFLRRRRFNPCSSIVATIGFRTPEKVWTRLRRSASSWLREEVVVHVADQVHQALRCAHGIES